MNLAPGSEALVNSYPPGTTQAIAVDVWDGDNTLVNIFLTNTGISYPILMRGGQNGILSDYNSTYDYFFIIGGDGIIKWRGTWNEPAMTAAMDAAVAELSATSVPDLAAAGHRLLPAYPNPFNPATRIPFALADGPGDVDVRLEVLDLRGRLVRTLAAAPFAAGQRHEVAWNGADADGRRLPSGTYLARLQVGDAATTRFLTLVK